MKTRLGTLVALLILPVHLVAGELSWEVSTLGGYDSNPAGYAGTTAQGLGWTQAKFGWERTTDEGRLSLSYTGSVYSFVPESDWTAHQHKVNAFYSEYWTYDLLVGTTGSVGGNWNRPAYSAYSYYELVWNGWMRRTATSWPVEARMELSWRRYPESNAFDFRGFGFNLSMRHQWPSRTSLQLDGGLAARQYSTVTVDDIIAGRTNASSRQYTMNAVLSQGLNEKTGLRLSGWLLKGSGESRWRDDYWQALDDPLARTGLGGRAQVSWLAPGGLTLRPYLGAHRLRANYVTAEGEHGARSDRLGEAGVFVEGLLPWTAAERIFSWQLELNAARQISDDPNYAYSRMAAMLGLKYAW